jgi:hypothetical protein
VRPATAAALIAAALVVLAGCGRSEFSTAASFDDVEAAVRDAGLQVCDVRETGAGPPGAVDERRYDIARDCADEDTAALLVATAYESEEDRDAAARRFEGQVRPPPPGVVWTLGPLTLRVTADRDPETVDALTKALDERGAE